MMDLQQALPAASAVKLISLTTDPDFDSPAILKKYSERFNANPKRWWFLTGTKAQIATLAIESLKLTAVEKKPEERQSPADLFVHSTIFVLVDKRGQLRGVYQTSGEGTEPGQVRSQLLAGIRRLEHEG
jgi:cytochrome oxidase Cu insertion factor (SCO1/SenC/PrrC family)